MDDHQQRVHFLVALLQVPAGALAQWVADSDSAVSTTLTRLLATSLEPDPDPVQHDNLRPLLHAVIARLVAHPKSNIPVPLLALYSHAFLESNYTLVTRNVIPDALASSPKLAQELRATCGPALIEALRLGGGGDGDLLRSHVVLSLIRATAHAGPLGPIVPQLVQTLNEAYPPLVSPAAGTDHPGLRRLRLAVLETAHDLVRVAASGATVPAVEALEPVLSHLLVASTPSSTTTTTTMLARDLVSMYEPLGAELAEAVQGAVGPVARNVKDQIARLGRLPAAAASSSSNEKEEEAEWLADLRASALGGAADPAVGTAREREESVTAADRREKNTRDGADPARILSKADTEADLAQAVASLLDLFPSESPQFLRACLIDPSFALNAGPSGETANLQLTTERVVEALLGEAQLPERLHRIRIGQADDDDDDSDDAAGGGGRGANVGEQEVESVAATSVTAAEVTERRNVYDDDKYFQRGTLLGPAASRGRSANASRAGGGGGGGNRLELDARLKASIIALAERESSDDEDDDDDDARYYDDHLGGEEEEAAGTATPRIKIGAAGEEPDENEQEVEADGGGRGGQQQQQQQPRGPSASSPYDPATVLVLEQAYLRSPAVFARDSATRRGKARKDLRDRTRLGDEQIEGWKIMLEREPKKLQKLQDKHTDLAARANRPTQTASADASSRNASPARAAGQHQTPPHLNGGGGGGGGSRGGASSGRGSGRGGGQGGGGGNGHGQGQQQQKRSDNGRREHDRAKRGRDRKLARMGAGPPPA